MIKGSFIISLDFELHWGAVEKWDLSQMQDYFRNTRESIPEVLSLFDKYGIHATWATVGFLFAKNKKQLESFIPSELPSYSNKNLDYYSYFFTNQVGINEDEDPFHFASSIIEQILRTPNQELASHTFTHYYCNESGQNIKQFEEDIQKAQEISLANFNTQLKSLVFPRNQFNKDYAQVAYENGIKTIRTNPDVYFWKGNGAYKPIARAFDTLMPISKPLSFVIDNDVVDGPFNIPASRFLRPYSKKESFIQKRKLNRILNEMKEAAKNGKCYHLWWHPHNFGHFPKENLIELEKILKYFEFLKEKYHFESKSMIEFVE
ncbi:polysaccharide deacetylase family protein [uncultured Dokdonia sp.]|uniref:polysaccharide deacetylase family protein n=1 Tax=uncultured Dokdonia sp. TaxID=575653 RepID=UPI0030EE712A|tara:strand:+ start:36964 stop:37920 length:957 start_codon:yes stop_codon:yes gene_type:complete